jgi:hypothetical protein
MSKDDDERLKNLVLFKMYATDKEVEEMMPVFAGITIVLIVLGLLYWLIGT